MNQSKKQKTFRFLFFILFVSYGIFLLSCQPEKNFGTVKDTDLVQVKEPDAITLNKKTQPILPGSQEQKQIMEECFAAGNSAFVSEILGEGQCYENLNKIKTTKECFTAVTKTESPDRVFAAKSKTCYGNINEILLKEDCLDVNIRGFFIEKRMDSLSPEKSSESSCYPNVQALSKELCDLNSLFWDQESEQCFRTQKEYETLHTENSSRCSIQDIEEGRCAFEVSFESIDLTNPNDSTLNLSVTSEEKPLLGDFDGNKFLDFFIKDSLSNNSIFLFNENGKTFTAKSYDSSLNSEIQSGKLSTLDFKNIGRANIAIRDDVNKILKIYYLSEDKSEWLSENWALNPSQENASLHSYFGIFDGMEPGLLSLAPETNSAFLSSNKDGEYFEHETWKMLKAAEYTLQPDLVNLAPPEMTWAQDLNSDGKTEILSILDANTSSATVKIFYNTDSMDNSNNEKYLSLQTCPGGIWRSAEHTIFANFSAHEKGFDIVSYEPSSKDLQLKIYDGEYCYKHFSLTLQEPLGDLVFAKDFNNDNHVDLFTVNSEALRIYFSKKEPNSEGLEFIPKNIPLPTEPILKEVLLSNISQLKETAFMEDFDNDSSPELIFFLGSQLYIMDVKTVTKN